MGTWVRGRGFEARIPCSLKGERKGKGLGDRLGKGFECSEGFGRMGFLPGLFYIYEGFVCVCVKE